MRKPILTWYKICDCMKRLTRVIKDIDVSKVISVPPKNNQLPRSASMAATEKHTNTNVVPIKAVIIMEGSTMLTYSIRGPKPIPRECKNMYINDKIL